VYKLFPNNFNKDDDDRNQRYIHTEYVDLFYNSSFSTTLKVNRKLNFVTSVEFISAIRQ